MGERDLTVVEAFEKGIDTLRVRARSTGGLELDLRLDARGAYLSIDQVRKDGSRRYTGGGRFAKRSFSQLFNEAIHRCGGQFRLESLAVSGAPAGLGPVLKEALLTLLAQLQGMTVPNATELRTARKAWREQQASEKAQQAKVREERKARAEAKILEAFPAAPPVVDAASFLTALRSRVLQHARIDAALSMLKKSGFQLYSDIGDEALQGVIASQSDPDLIYACRIDASGGVSCCTQNLNICGGLRGEACKHLLTLLIGLVNAGQVDPTRVDAWLAAARGKKPVLDKDKLGDVFLRYHGAQAGEVDWRPTETVPEDFYAW